MDYRLEKIIDIIRYLQEEPTMSVGAGGFTSAANPQGPVAGFDPVLGTVDRRKKRYKNYPSAYVKMYRNLAKGKNVLKSIKNV